METINVGFTQHQTELLLTLLKDIEVIVDDSATMGAYNYDDVKTQLKVWYEIFEELHKKFLLDK